MREQLSYYIAVQQKIFSEFLGLSLTVQSDYDTAYVEGRIDSFLHDMKVYIQEMDLTEYEEHKRSLIHRKTQRYESFWDLAEFFWGRIDSRFCNFSTREAEGSILETVTKQEILHLLETLVHPSPRVRRKLSIRLCSPAVPRKFSISAGQALLDQLRDRHPTLSEELGSGLYSEISVASVKEHTRRLFGKELSNADATDQLIDRLSELYPVGPIQSDLAKLRAVEPSFIKDKDTFKASLTPGIVPQPVETDEHV